MDTRRQTRGQTVRPASTYLPASYRSLKSDGLTLTSQRQTRGSTLSASAALSLLTLTVLLVSVLTVLCVLAGL